MNKIAVVIVTYNRAELLSSCLDALAKQTVKINTIYVIENACTDHTATMLAERTDLPLVVINNTLNTGGAGGFSQGTEIAFRDEHEWIWLMDDDVFPKEDCLEKLLAIGDPAMMAVREDTNGKLVERSALIYDLKNPFCLNPKKSSIEGEYSCRSEMPIKVNISNIAFEGFFVNRAVIRKIGFPACEYFIFYDDVDYAMRILNQGIPIVAVRDACLVRQLPFNQQHATTSWKGFYMYRNFFIIHYIFGKNIFVKAKPIFLVLGAILVKSIKSKNDRKELSIIIKALIKSFTTACQIAKQHTRR